MYSDLVTVFQVRECGGSCLTIPYVNGFIEYPVIASIFIYLMGATAAHLPGELMSDYYWLSALFLAVPTFLLIRELYRISEIIGGDERRTLRYFVATPSFVVVLLVSWYVIGVYFAFFGLRKYLQGNFRASGLLLGLSAASNLVTAAPGFGLFLAAKTWRDRLTLALVSFGCYAAVNLPFIIVNADLWLSSFEYYSNWYIEGSWMLAFLPSFSPLRHYIFPVLLLVLLGIITGLALRTKQRQGDPLTFAWIATFAALFSNYVFTPQMNLIILPFFVLIPIVKRYWEFLAFDLINAVFITLGFSQVLLVFGITYSFDVSTYAAPVRWLAIIRSVWLGKMLVFNGLVPLARGRLRPAVRTSQSEPP